MGLLHQEWEQTDYRASRTLQCRVVRANIVGTGQGYSGILRLWSAGLSRAGMAESCKDGCSFAPSCNSGASCSLRVMKCQEATELQHGKGPKGQRDGWDRQWGEVEGKAVLLPWKKQGWVLRGSKPKMAWIGMIELLNDNSSEY